ncbi:glycosyltransferase [Methylobacterium isbiliense]|uniref:Glycosyl transferase family 1 domain-containing protein n=1 Tax=Methylobacterium isbiliense TaxID=315478 RepID=A0ABQ4SN91_9HYPH|nr:glycosyltransferase [Methylobacterium isbiliense]MDN3627918.1 glycosyltransferase [Methylobacterium isbiliense]GJE04612.1 hypothetical protein GMJLKIPL_6576 [Methylobacterium isbiliense]
MKEKIVAVDLTEFVANPIRTGIQRVVLGFIENLKLPWIAFSVIDRHNVKVYGPEIATYLRSFFEDAELTMVSRVVQDLTSIHQRTTKAHLDLLIYINANNHVLQIDKLIEHCVLILNFEMFSSEERSEFYLNIYNKSLIECGHFVHDLILFDSPHLFPQLDWAIAYDYVKVLKVWKGARFLIVSNERVKSRLEQSLNFDPSRIFIVPLGGNLTNALQEAANRTDIVVIGTIEPRKYPIEIAKALTKINRRSFNKIHWIGSWGWIGSVEKQFIERCFAMAEVEHHVGIPDQSVIEILSRSSIGIYISEIEGFGLPVVEMAYMGLHVITNNSVPAADIVQNATVLQNINEHNLVYYINKTLQSDFTPSSYTHKWEDSANILIDKMSNTVAIDLVAKKVRFIETLSDACHSNVSNIQYILQISRHIITIIKARNGQDFLNLSYKLLLCRYPETEMILMSPMFDDKAARLIKIREITHSDEFASVAPANSFAKSKPYIDTLIDYLTERHTKSPNLYKILRTLDLEVSNYEQAQDLLAWYYEGASIDEIILYTNRYANYPGIGARIIMEAIADDITGSKCKISNRVSIRDFDGRNNEQFVVSMYRRILRKEADPEGLRSYIYMLESRGMSRYDVAIKLMKDSNIDLHKTQVYE